MVAGGTATAGPGARQAPAPVQHTTGRKLWKWQGAAGRPAQRKDGRIHSQVRPRMGHREASAAREHPAIPDEDGQGQRPKQRGQSAAGHTRVVGHYRGHVPLSRRPAGTAPARDEDRKFSFLPIYIDISPLLSPLSSDSPSLRYKYLQLQQTCRASS